MKVICDIETDSLDDPKNIWVIVCKEVETGEVHVFRRLEEATERRRFRRYASGVQVWIGHNFLGYDLAVLNSLLSLGVSALDVIDTLVISRLLWYKRPGGHSLEALGNTLGYPKDTFSDFSQWSQELEDRCIQDVEITWRVYQEQLPYINSSQWNPSISIEHAMVIILGDVHSNGFKFNYDRAVEIHNTLRNQLDVLDGEIVATFPPRTKQTRQITPRVTKHGTLHKGDFRFLGTDPDLSSYSVGHSFSTFSWIEFNPGSPSQIVERLNEAGWKPTEKTKGGESYKVNENNLATLPDSAPEATRKLVQRFLLKKRVTTLEEWFEAYKPTSGRIHGTINNIGAWTQRCSHVRPNMGNVPSVASKYQAADLKALAKSIGIELRSLWICDDNKVLVGCDADGIQLRIFAHYINDLKFTTALVSGSSKDGTDAHSLNALALGGVTRDQAKTFIYAFLLGAGLAKTATILGCSMGEAEERRNGFIARYPGLQYVREDLIPRDVSRGYFEGFDGRKVVIDEAKRKGNTLGFVLGGYLQNGEACIMKHANLSWRKELVSNEIPFKQVNFVHDEWQTECHQADAKGIGAIQSTSITQIGRDFGLNCPMAGNFKIGRNWYETH